MRNAQQFFFYSKTEVSNIFQFLHFSHLIFILVLVMSRDQIIWRESRDLVFDRISIFLDVVYKTFLLLSLFNIYHSKQVPHHIIRGICTVARHLETSLSSSELSIKLSSLSKTGIGDTPENDPPGDDGDDPAGVECRGSLLITFWAGSSSGLTNVSR